MTARPSQGPAAALAFVALAALSRPAAAQTFPEWLNQRVDEVVATRLAQRGSGRQVESPSIAGGSTTLVNHAAFADLVGVALNLVNDAGESGAGANGQSTAITITPFTVLAAVLGLNPDDPFVYQREGPWRAVALTLGTENADSTGGSGVGGTGGGYPVVLAGLKAKVWSRQAVDPTSPKVQQLRSDLGLAGSAFGDLSAQLQDSLYAWVGGQAGLDRVSFINQLSNDSASVRTYLDMAGPERVDVLLRMITAAVDPFVKLRTAANDVVEALRGAPQLALDVQSRLREGGGDEVRVGLVLDVGLTRRARWTVNGSANLVTASGSTPRTWGGTLASGLTLDLGPDRMAGPDPLALDLAFEADVVESQTPTWRLQAKLAVPVLEGISLPVSIAWASRTELVDESDVFGRVGFTVDTSRLLAAVQGG